MKKSFNFFFFLILVMKKSLLLMKKSCFPKFLFNLTKKSAILKVVIFKKIFLNVS